MESNDISHRAEVLKVSGRNVRLAVYSQGACGGCKVRESCGMVEQTTREIDIVAAKDDEYVEGESVYVNISLGMGRMAVVLAYVIPLVLLVLFLVLGGFLGFAEWLVALMGLVGVACYYYFLYLVRGNIEKKINFTITKNGDFNLYNPNT